MAFSPFLDSFHLLWVGRLDAHLLCKDICPRRIENFVRSTAFSSLSDCCDRQT